MLVVLITAAVFGAVALLAYLFVSSLAKGYSAYEERYLRSATAALSQLSIIMPPERLLLLKVIAGFVFGTFGFAVGSAAPPPFPLIVFGIAAAVGSFLPDFYLHWMLEKRRKTFGIQLVEAMNTLSNGLKSGFSFRQALELTARQVPDPCGLEFRIALHQVDLGVSLPDALRNMTDRLDDKDLELMVTAANLCLQVGGDLPTVFGQIVETIRDRNRIEEKVDALTSQGRMQATIVGLIPFALALIVRSINPEMMKPMFTTILGWTMLLIVIALDVAGYYMIRRIVSIRY